MTDEFQDRMNLRTRKDSINTSAFPNPRGTPDWLNKKDTTDTSSRASKLPKNKRMKKPSRGRKAEAGQSSKANLSGVDEIQSQSHDHSMEDTWSVAEFRRRYIVLQHKYCELEKSFARKVKDTCERHLKGVNKITQEMKDALSHVEIDAIQRCCAKDEQFANYKQSSDSKIEELQTQLEEALKKLVLYETKSKEAGIIILDTTTQSSIMLSHQSTEIGSNTTIDPHSKAANKQQVDPNEGGAMDIDEGPPPMIDLSQKDDKNKDKNEESSIQCVQNWSDLNRDQRSLRNEWNYEQDQLNSHIKVRHLERASWGVDLCPEKRSLIDGEIQIQNQVQNDAQEAFQTPIKEPQQEALNLTYSKRKSPFKSRAEKLFSDPPEVLSTYQNQLLNLGVLPDLASIGFKCYLVSENEAVYQHVLTNDTFSLLCESFDPTSPTEIAYRPISCQKLKHFLPEYLEDEIMFEKSEIHKFARIIGESVLHTLTAPSMQQSSMS